MSTETVTIIKLYFNEMKVKDKNGKEVLLKYKNGKQLFIDLRTSLVIINPHNSPIAVGEWNNAMNDIKYFPEPFKF